MALDKLLVPINFTSGIDTLNDRHAVQPPSMLEMTNARFITRGTVQKRNGYLRKGSAATNAIKKVVDSGSGVLAFDQPSSGYQRLLTYDRGQDLWAEPHGLSPQFVDCNVSVSDLAPSSAKTQTHGDLATGSDGAQTLYAWAEPYASITAVHWCIKDRSTGGFVASPQMIGPYAAAGDTAPRVFAIGTVLCMGLYDSSNNLVRLFYYNAATGTMTAGSTISNIKSGGLGPWDVCVIGSTAYIATYDTSGGNAIHLFKVNNTATVTSSATLSITGSYTATASIGFCMAVPSASSTVLRIFWFDATNGVQGLFVTASNLASIGQKTIDSDVTTGAYRICAIEATTSTYHLFVQRAALGSMTLSPFTVDYFNGTDNSASPTKLATQRAMYLASKPILLNSVPHLAMAIPDKVALFNQSAFLYQLIKSGSSYYFSPSAKFLDSSYSQETSGAPMLCNLSMIGTSSASCLLGKVSTLSDVWYDEAKFDFAVSTDDWSDKLTSINASDVTHLGGGFHAIFDGVSVIENNFFVPPYITAANVSQTTSGGNISAGVYEYAVTYEWRDARGRIHESEPSVPVSVTVAAGSTNKITISLPTLRSTLKSSVGPTSRSDVSIVVYRTEDAGDIFYRLSSTATNDTTADSVSFSDGSSDVSISSHATLYTTTDVDNMCVDGPRVIATIGDRVFVDDPFDPYVVHYSKKITNGYATEFGVGMDIHLPQDGNGRVQAIGFCAGNLIVWKSKGVYVTQGEGLDDTGETGGYPEFQKIHQDVGCTGPQMIAETPDGNLFRSQKGYYQLGRDMSLGYVGAAVKSYESTAALSMDVVRSQSHVRVLLDDDTALVYDYRFGLWTRFASLSAVDAVVVYDSSQVADVLYLAGDDTSYKGVFYEDSATYADAQRGSGIYRMTVTTPWLAMAGIEGMQRVYALLFAGEAEGGGTSQMLACDISYDYVDDVAESHQISQANATYGTTDYNVEVRPNRQRCRAAKFSIYDYVIGGEHFRLSNLTLVVGILKGSAKLASQKRV